jgi:Zn-finger nucleic acid-binding protein
MLFAGSRHCPHCGARGARAESTSGELPCPRCGTALHAARVGDADVHDCAACGGIWLDADTFHAVTADRERQSAVLAFAPPLDRAQNAAETVRYAPCPRCRGMMNRLNFARVSGVVVDTCRQHGTWFDRDELRRIVEFIQGGGLEAARHREKIKLEDERRHLERMKQSLYRTEVADAPRGAGGLEINLTSLVSFLMSE